MKRPSFQFYPALWLQDPALRSCSMEARALWIDMICLMHEGVPYGHLTLPNGKEITKKTLGKLWEIHGNQINKMIKELEENGVIRYNKNGIIYSKKMVEDEAQRQEWKAQKANQRKSACPPNVRKDKKSNVRNLSGAVSGPSFSSSSSLEEEERGAPKAPPLSSSEVTPENLARLSDEELHQVGEMLKIEPKGETHRQRIDRSFLEDMWWAELMIRNRGPAKQEGAR